LYQGDGSPAVAWYDVPALGVRIAFRGTSPLIHQIIGTLAPSAATIVRDGSALLSTHGWLRVAWGNVEVRVPPTWKAEDLAANLEGCDGATHASTLLVGGPGIIPSCPPPAYLQPVADGARLGSGRAEGTGHTIHAGPVALQDLTSPLDRMQELVFHVRGTGTNITISGGRDGRVAATVLRSVRRVSASRLTVEGCPAAAPIGPEKGALRRETPVNLLVCRYHGSVSHGAVEGALAAAASGDAHKFAAMLRDLRPFNPFGCTGGAADALSVLRFTYADGRRVDALVHDESCFGVSVGGKVRSASPELRAAVGDVVGNDCTFTPNSVSCGR
jgi:hypothetical protein